MSIEVITEALVLGKEDCGEQDSRIFLYTKAWGKVAAKATSVRKITSKLAGHVEPLSHVNGRFISKSDGELGNNVQLADVLLISKRKIEPDSDVRDLKKALRIFALAFQMIPWGVPDEELWNFLYGIFSGRAVAETKDLLAFLGFDSKYAECELCQASQPEYFFLKKHSFACERCFFESAIEKKYAVKI